MNTETTIVDKVTAPEATLTAIRDAIEVLKSGDIIALAQRIHDEIAPHQRAWNALPDGLDEVVSDRSGWTELYLLLSHAASALNYCLGDYPTADGFPDFLTDEDVDRLNALEARRATLYAGLAESTVTV